MKDKTLKALESYLALPLISLELTNGIGILSKQLQIKAMGDEIKDYIERNTNSIIEIKTDGDDHSLVIKNKLLNDDRTRSFKIIINQSWSDFKVEQLSESHENLFITIKKFST